MHVLFVCLGNICRSPAAEAVLKHLITERGLESRVHCDSAGIIGYHAGNKADSRMITHAYKRGYNVTSISRPFNPEIDFDIFDLILGMDHENIEALEKMARNKKDKEKIGLLASYTSLHTYDVVPDPYYGGDEGFELVLDLLEDACSGILESIPND